MVRPKNMEEPRRQEMRFPAALLNRVDDWRFANRVEGRSEAIRRLVEIGLEAESAKVAADAEA